MKRTDTLKGTKTNSTHIHPGNSVSALWLDFLETFLTVSLVKPWESEVSVASEPARVRSEASGFLLLPSPGRCQPRRADPHLAFSPPRTEPCARSPLGCSSQCLWAWKTGVRRPGSIRPLRPRCPDDPSPVLVPKQKGLERTKTALTAKHPSPLQGGSGPSSSHPPASPGGPGASSRGSAASCSSSRS